MTKRALLCISIIIVLSLIGNITYSQTELSEKPKNEIVSPTEVFEQVWNLLNANYPYFEQRGIDWNAMYKVYKSKINPQTTDDELFTVLSNMLEHFNDGHINLEAGNKRFCSNIRTNAKMEDFSWKLVKDKYLKNNFKSSPDSLFYYGWLTEEIAYMRIRRFPPKEILEKYIDDIIAEIIKAKGLIIDVRGNPGGNGFGVAALGSRFADRKRLFEKNLNRIGGSKKEYISPTYHYIEPLGPAQYRGPIILLQNVYSESGSELFALAMRVLPNATSIGETTGGCFATYYPDKLLNGWTLSMPFSYTVDQNDFCWEGIGVPPNIRKINTKEDISEGKDKVLQFAIELIEAGGHYRKETGGSTNEIRISLVDQFVETAKKNNLQSAVTQFKEDIKDSSKKYYLSIQEYGLTVKMFLQTEKIDEALALFELGLEQFPEEINTLYYLARIYDNVKKMPEKAKPFYKKLANLKPSFPWEKTLVDEAKNNI